MENGDRFGGQTHPYPTAELVPFSPNTIVTPEDYRANLERLQKIKAALTFYEEQNNQGLQRYYEEKQALESAVEQGRLAAYVIGPRALKVQLTPHIQSTARTTQRAIHHWVRNIAYYASHLTCLPIVYFLRRPFQSRGLRMGLYHKLFPSIMREPRRTPRLRCLQVHRLWR